MYKNQFQYGTHLMLLNITEKGSIDKWHVQGTLKKAYDKSAKGFVFVMDSNTRLKQPQDTRRKELGIIQPFLIIQCKVLNKQTFHIEVMFTDQDNKKKRLILYASQFYNYGKDNIHRFPLHARIPCGMIMEGMWMNLQIDLRSFVNGCFEKVAFSSIDGIEIGGACLIRRIITTKFQLPDSFPYVIERDFGEQAAIDFEQYVANKHQVIDSIDKQINF